VVKNIKSDINYMEDVISQMKAIDADRNPNTIKNSLLRKQINDLEIEVKRLKTYGNTLTTKYKPTKIKPPENVAEPEKITRQVDNLLNQHRDEIDTLKEQYLVSEGNLEKILEKKGVSPGKTLETITISKDRPDILRQYETKVAEALQEIEDLFLDSNNEIKSPFSKLKKRTNLGGIIEELNQLGADVETYEEIIGSLTNQHRDMVEKQITFLNKTLRRLSKG